MTHCRVCPEPAEAGNELCGPHSVELEYRVAAGEPGALFRECEVCGGKIELTAARVLREAMTGKGDRDTPFLCWVCAHLKHAAHRDATDVPLF